jgi:hypothetical protein
MKKHQQFVERFIEVCGTSRPAEIQRLLKVPYQSIRNYLDGRLPNAEMLITISERTSCSIGWLLTGKGKKFVKSTPSQDTPLPPGQIEHLVRKVCVEVINEIALREEMAQPKIVVLQSSELMSEKAPDEAKTFTGRKP